MRKDILLYVTLSIFLLTGSLCQAGGSVCLKDLGTLGGTKSLANGINEAGQIVGWANMPGVDPQDQHAFLWKNGVMQDLGTLGGTNSIAYGLNDLVQIVGVSNMPGVDPQDQHAVIWENDTIHDLGTLGGIGSAAFGINNSGQIVGATDTAGVASQDHHAALWVWGNNAVQNIQDLGVLEGGTDSEALWINDSGQIVGWSNISGVDPQDQHAVIWENDTIHDLGTLGGSASEAYAINEKGQIVGGSYTAGDLEWHAFLWQNGVMQDLGTLGGITSDAFAINEKGQITGASYISDVEFHAFSASRCVKGLPWLMLLLD